MIIYGWNPVREAIRAHPERIRYVAVANNQREKVRKLLAEAKAAGVGVRHLPPQQLDRMANGEVHNGVVAEVSESGYSDFEDVVDRPETEVVFLLDGVQDPHNFGAILRVADCFGVDLVVIPEHESVGLTAAAVKASAGASEWVTVAQVTNLSRSIEKLKEAGFWVYAADAGGEPVGAIDLTGKVAVVLGSEGRGIRRNVVEHCDRTVAIPISGRIESLNVSTAAAVLAYEIGRQRHASSAVRAGGEKRAPGRSE